MGHLFIFFCIFFMFTIFGIPDIERRKKKEKGSLSESRNSHIFTHVNIIVLQNV